MRTFILAAAAAATGLTAVPATAQSNRDYREARREYRENVREARRDYREDVREARRDFDRATKLPAEFVREQAAQASAGYHAWAKARAASDFASYVPVLEKNLELAKREAVYLGWGDRPYDYMIDRHDPGMSAAVITKLFAELKTGLVPLVWVHFS